MAKRPKAPTTDPVRAAAKRKSTAATHPVVQHKNPNKPAAPPPAAVRPGGDAAIAKTARVAMPRQPGFKVRATRMGYHNDERKRVGDVFTLTYAHEFTEKWMERVPDRTPHRATTGQQELRKAHDETLKERASSVHPGIDNPIGGPDVIGAGDDDGGGD